MTQIVTSFQFACKTSEQRKERIVPCYQEDGKCESSNRPSNRDLQTIYECNRPRRQICILRATLSHGLPNYPHPSLSTDIRYLRSVSSRIERTFKFCPIDVIFRHQRLERFSRLPSRSMINVSARPEYTPVNSNMVGVGVLLP